MQDVLVIGGGVIGLWSALELSRRGCRVTVVDAGADVPAASWAGGGILSPLFAWRYPDALTCLTDQAIPRYRELVAEISDSQGPVPELDECGLLVEMPDDHDRALRWSRDRGHDVRAVDATEVQADVRFQRALWFPALGAVRNPGLLRGLRFLLEREGVALFQDRVLDLQAGQSDVLLRGERREYRSGKLLVAAGKESATLLSRLGVSLPLFPVKGEMLMFRGPPGLLKTVLLSEDGYLIPRRDGRILAGSTLEPGVDSCVPSREAGVVLYRRALNLLPSLEGCPLEAQWAGVRPGNDDGVPWISSVPRHDNVWVATGHYRNGLVSAPVTAGLVAHLVTGQRPSLDVTPYRLAD